MGSALRVPPARVRQPLGLPGRVYARCIRVADQTQPKTETTRRPSRARQGHRALAEEVEDRRARVREGYRCVCENEGCRGHTRRGGVGCEGDERLREDAV